MSLEFDVIYHLQKRYLQKRHLQKRHLQLMNTLCSDRLITLTDSELKTFSGSKSKTPPVFECSQPAAEISIIRQSGRKRRAVVFRQSH